MEVDDVEDDEVTGEEDDDVEEGAHVRGVISLLGFPEECRATRPWTILCASPRSQHTCQHVTRETLYENVRNRAVPQEPDPRSAQACAV